jgi:PWWP domain
MKWAPFNEDLKRQWMLAYDEAERSAEMRAVEPVACLASQSIRGKGARQVGYLSPGTVVWACLQEGPIWPARVCAVTTKEHMELGSTAAKDETEPLMFMNDEDQDRPLYSSTHSCYGFSTDRCWQAHMKERTLATAQERDWEPNCITKKTWKQWDEACKEAFQVCSSPEEGRRPRKRRRS